MPVMKRCFAMALLVVLTGTSLRLAGATPVPPIALALTLNDGVADRGYRGWPLILRADAVLTEELTAGLALNRSELVLSVVSSTGADQNWPLRPVGDVSSPIRLGGDVDSIRITWLLTAEQSAALAPGTYLATAAWSGRKSPPLRFVVADPPPSPNATDQIRRAQLRSEAAVFLGDLDLALAATRPAGIAADDSITLLLQRARVHERRAEFQEMLRATQRALALFHQQSPRANHAPVAILSLQSKALAKLVTPPPGGFPKADLKNSPSPTPSPPRSVNAPVAPVQSPGSATSPADPAAKIGAPSPGTIVRAAELDDAKVRADAAGQWAATARAGSFQSNTYNYYTPARATGAPKVAYAGYNTDAWCPAQQNTGEDWLELTFAKETKAAAVRVRQTFNPGAIVKVEAIAPDGTTHLWWQGTDPYQRPATREIAWFAVNVPPTSYPVAKIRLTLNLAAVPGWKQIDAVQLVGAP